MKKYLSGLGIAAVLLMCAYPSCEAEEQQQNAGQHASVGVEVEKPEDAAKAVEEKKDKDKINKQKRCSIRFIGDLL